MDPAPPSSLGFTSGPAKFEDPGQPCLPGPGPKVLSWLFFCSSASELVLISVPVSFSYLPSLPTPTCAGNWGTAEMGQTLETEPNTVMGPSSEAVERRMPEKNRLRERDRRGESRKAGRETELRSEPGKSSLRPAVGLVLEGTPCPACPLHPQQPLPRPALPPCPLQAHTNPVPGQCHPSLTSHCGHHVWNRERPESLSLTWRKTPSPSPHLRGAQSIHQPRWNLRDL